MIDNAPRDGEKIIEEGVASRNFFLFIDQVKESLNDILTPRATTAELEDISNPINTGAAKVLGYSVLNTTTGVTVFAAGSANGSVWHYYNESTAHTPV